MRSTVGVKFAAICSVKARGVRNPGPGNDRPSRERLGSEPHVVIGDAKQEAQSKERALHDAAEPGRHFARSYSFSSPSRPSTAHTLDIMNIIKLQK